MTRRLAAVFLVAVLFLAACGDDDTTDTAATDDDSSVTDESSSSDDADGDAATDDDGCGRETDDDLYDGTLTAEPAEGLTDGDVILVSGANLSPGTCGSIALCSDQGFESRAEDCDFTTSVDVTIGADGTFGPTEITVTTGPFGDNERTCGAGADPCRIVYQSSANVQESATADLAFA